MKVRTVTIGVELIAKDLIEVDGTHPINEKLKKAKSALTSITSSLVAAGYEVQTQRVSFNNFEEWLLDGDSDNAGGKESASYVALVNVLLHYLKLHSIEICSIGCCSSSFAISLVPLLLSLSDCLYCSALFLKTEKDDIAPDSALILKAAHTLVEIAKSSGIFGCFRFCSSFNCAGGTPFFPASFHDARAENCAFPAPLISQQVEISNPMATKINGFLVSIGLECADLLFIAFYGAKSISEGSRNLSEVLLQALLPIQDTVLAACSALSIAYGGIDASINPGLSLSDSVGAGLESLISPPQESKNPHHQAPIRQFGAFGTLAAVSAVTKAVKILPEKGIKLIGYNGLMLPVMEDLVLAERASQLPSTYSLRDLLTFSAVCGVGLDTVPVPGDTTAEEIADVYMETAALAFRLNKPLSCRLLIMPDKAAGDLTDVVHPYICNTHVFSIHS